MKHLFIKLRSFFNTIEGKIAFYPTLMAFAGFNLAFFMAYLENKGISRTLLENVPQLILEDGDTALSVLSVCMGGLISMMVFSFSMVMLLLSQASSNFSPRLLPGLISDKKNQIILGTYLASILYMIFILFSIESDDKKYTLPGLSILIAIILTFTCLGAFIYFIHNMSQSIQINNILDDIFIKSKKRLSMLIEKEKKDGRQTSEDFPNTDNWYSYTTNNSGYFQNISLRNVIEICEEQDTRVHVMIPKGFFVLQHVPFIKSEKELSEETVKSLLSNINFSRSEFVEDNYILAFKQITEIAVKAMSPGINDPGTAINAIDYLTELFALRMLKTDSGVLIRNGEARIKVEVVSFKELLYNSMASLRTYCRHDPILVQKMIWMLSYLKEQAQVCDDSYIPTVAEELQILLKDAKSGIQNKGDFEQVKDLAEQIS